MAEHVRSLLVAGGDPAIRIYGEFFMGYVAASSFRFGAGRTLTASVA